MFRTSMIAALAVAAAVGLGGCQSPGERAVGGALIGGGSGALIGGALGGRRGALTGAAIGGVGGAIAGAATTPEPAYGYRRPVYVEEPVYVRRPRCPYGVVYDEFGNAFCR